MKSRKLIAVLLVAIVFVGVAIKRNSTGSAISVPQNVGVRTVDVSAAPVAPHAAASRADEGPASTQAESKSEKDQPPLNGPGIEEYKRLLALQTDTELDRLIKRTDAQIAKTGVIGRANQNSLTREQTEEFANLLNRKSAAQILLIERSLAAAERQHL